MSVIYIKNIPLLKFQFYFQDKEFDEYIHEALRVGIESFKKGNFNIIKLANDVADFLHDEGVDYHRYYEYFERIASEDDNVSFLMKLLMSLVQISYERRFYLPKSTEKPSNQTNQ